jgi:CYTH domain-containing protein
MGVEIERKFLVQRDRLPTLDRARAAEIEQGYLSFEPSVRVRRATYAAQPPRAWITIKGRGTVERSEFEYAIPPEDAEALLAMCPAKLTKLRHRIDAGARHWDLDEFTGAHQGLWLAEIELERADEVFDRPAWLGAEVSHDARYTNGALARAGRVPE